MYINRIKYLIKIKKRSINEVARLIGMSSTGFHAALNRDTLKVRDLYKIASILQVSIKYFFYEEQESKQNLLSGESQIQYLVDSNSLSTKENVMPEYQTQHEIEIKLIQQKIKTLETESKLKDDALAMKDTIIKLLQK